MRCVKSQHARECSSEFIMLNFYFIYSFLFSRFSLWNSSRVLMFCSSLKCMLHLVPKLLFPPPPHHIILTKGLQVISSRYCYSSGPAHSLQILLTRPHPSIQPSHMTMGEKLRYTLWEEIRDQEPVHLSAAHMPNVHKIIFCTSLF